MNLRINQRSFLRVSGALIALLSFTSMNHKAFADNQSNVQSGEVDWASVNINPAKLKSGDSKTYTFSYRKRNEQQFSSLGSIALSTEVKAGVVLMKDKYQINYKGENKAYELIHNCKIDKFLSPVRIEVIGEAIDGAEVSGFVVIVENGKAKISASNGRKGVRDLPEGTISAHAMMRLVTLVPRTPGSIYKFNHMLESQELNLKKDFRLEVLPVETITISGQELQCTKFKLTGARGKPVYYWVSKDGILQRLLMDERKLLELTEK